ncbi:unnamed protein product [Symbiodinium sp. CCMP2592]|nr:unnamed protein product [Symbiodinium sp. CCMP2592]
MSVVVCAGGTVFLENPVTSLLFETKFFLDWVRRMRKIGLPAPHPHWHGSALQSYVVVLLSSPLIPNLCQVYKTNFWMKHYNSPTMKRTTVISNRSSVRKLDKGKVPKSDRKCQFPTSKKTPKNGIVTWTATPFLKQTQEYTPSFARAIVDMLPRLQAQDVNIPVEGLGCVSNMVASMGAPEHGDARGVRRQLEAEELLREIRERKRLKGKGCGRSDPTEIGDGVELPDTLRDSPAPSPVPLRSGASSSGLSDEIGQDRQLERHEEPRKESASKPATGDGKGSAAPQPEKTVEPAQQQHPPSSAPKPDSSKSLPGELANPVPKHPASVAKPHDAADAELKPEHPVSASENPPSPAAGKPEPSEPVSKPLPSVAPEPELPELLTGEDHDGDAASMLNIPDLCDKQAPSPPPSEMSLSDGAIDRRMRRVFTARVDGTVKVPQKFVDQWRKRGDARKSLQKIFASCGYNPEDELTIEGEYTSEATMREWGWSETRIAAVKKYCASNPGRFMRQRDTYEEGLILYWCEKAIKATHKFQAEGVAGDSGERIGPINSPWEGQEEIKPAEAAGTPNKEALDLRKRANVPEIDPDALPSSYCQKLLLCLTKRTNKLQDIRDECKSTNDKGENTLTSSQNKMFSKLGSVIADLESMQEKIEEIHTAGVCDGFTAEHEDELRKCIHGVKLAVEALMLEPRARTVLPRASDAKPKLTPKAKASGKAAPKVKLVKEAMKLIQNLVIFSKPSLRWLLMELVPAAAMARVSEAAVSDGLQGIAVGDAAKANVNNAERAAHHLFAQWGLRLNVPITYIILKDGSQTLKFPILKPSNWIRALLRSHPSALFGNCKLEEVPDRWPRAASDQDWSLSDHDLSELMCQWHATSGHSFLARYLNYVIPTASLDLGPWVLDGVQKAIADDLYNLFHTGLVVDGRQYYVGLVGMKGDAKWHARVGMFTRSYLHLGDVANYEICHDCLAGNDDYPFEETGHNPAWVQTIGDSEPWDAPGVFETVPFDNTFPSFKYKRDLLHTFKIGLGRDICGGIIMLLCRFFGLFDYPGDSKGVLQRLGRAHARFAMWASAEKHTPHLRKFTKDFMHHKTSQSYSFTASKGSDTILLLQWLRLECRLGVQKLAGHRSLNMLKAAAQICEASTKMFWLLYNHGLWIPRRCMQIVRDNILRVVRGYSYVAQLCCEEKFAAFRCKTTLHSVHHFAVEIDIALQRGAICYLNPLVHDCSQSEDFVGRTARTARATHGRTLALRTLQRHLVKSKAMLRKLKA